MNPRERILAAILVVIVLVGGVGFGVWKVYLPMLKAKDKELNDLEAKIPIKQGDIAELKLKQDKLKYWQQISLPNPNDLAMAQREYDRWMDNLLGASGFQVGAMTIKPRKLEDPGKVTGPRGKKPAFTRLTFNVDGTGNLESLVRFLDSFYGTPLLHRIRSMAITKPQTLRQGQRQDELDIAMVVEALVLDGAETRAGLLPAKPPEPPKAAPTGPTEKAAEPPAKRDYADIYARNIFTGPVYDGRRQNPVEITRYYRLTTVWENHWSQKSEAYIRDLAGPTPTVETRMRASAGFDTFVIKDLNGKDVIKGKVVKIDMDNRDVLFTVDGKYYRIHVGESFESAMRKPIPDGEVKSLGLAVASTP
jgi:hypothetical protein